MERVTLGEHYLEDALRQLDKLKQLADGAIADFDPDYLQAVGPLFTVAVGLAMRRVGDK